MPTHHPFTPTTTDRELARDRCEAARLAAVRPLLALAKAATELADAVTWTDDATECLRRDVIDMRALADRCITPVLNAAAAIKADNEAGDAALDVTPADLAEARERSRAMPEPAGYYPHTEIEGGLDVNG